MRDLRFDTQRLNCRPLENSDIPAFTAIVSFDKWIQHYFEIGFGIDVVKVFFDSLQSYECFPVIACLDSSTNIVGYINGFVRSPSELLIEYFIVEDYRKNGYARELLLAYLDECVKYGFSTFKFDVEDGNLPSANLLESLGATRCVDDDFVLESNRGKRTFFTYEIIR